MRNETMDTKALQKFLLEIQNQSKGINGQAQLSYDEERLKACREFFNKNLSQHSFCWFRKTHNLEIRNAIGLSALGHHELTTVSALQIIHPDHINFYLQLIKSLQDIWRKSKQGESILNFSYLLNLPIRDANSKYWLIRQKIMPCQINNSSQVLDSLIWNDVLRPYYGEPVTLKAFSHQGSRMLDMEEKIKANAGYYKMLPFTPSQIKVLKAYLKKPEGSASEIGRDLSLEGSTIFTHNKNLLIRSRQQFGRNFKHTKQLVDFMRRHEVFGQNRL